MSKIPLSISLVKESITALENILKDIDIPHCSIDGVGTLYFKDSSRKEAGRIQSFFGDKLPAQDDAGAHRPVLYTASVQAVLLVRRRIAGHERIFLVTFGIGRNLVKNDCIQDKFGMYVVLNSISPDTIRSVDINVLESVPKHDRIQSTKLSKMNTFNLNVERDLLRAVTGKAKDAYKDTLGETVTGADTLKIAIEICVDNLSERLEQIYNIYKKTDYKTNFAWIDKITPIKDSALINALDAEMIQNINDGHLSLVWMSIPEMVNWEDLNAIRYTPQGLDYYDLDISTLLSDVFLNQPVDKAKLLAQRVYAFSLAGYKIDNWNVYRCLCSEVTKEGNQYILTNGHWYMIDQVFATEVNGYYENAQLSAFQLEPSHINEEEGKYNERVTQINTAERLMMDRRLVKPSDGQDEIEFCDVYTTDKKLIHIKRYSGSATLSHLFNQGLVSGELLMQKEFRKNLNDAIRKIGRDIEHRSLDAWLVDQANNYFHREDYEIVYAIITDTADARPSIPFFSKVAFRHVCRRLLDYGYHVSLMKIGIDDVDVKPELTQKRAEKRQKAIEKLDADK